MSDPTDFDEENDVFMSGLGASMAMMVPLVFPPTLMASEESHTLHFAAVSAMKTADIARFLQVVDTCLGAFYTKHNGRNWKRDKIEEMSEAGLVYVWYESENAISCFLSMRMVMEPAGKTLYLYEIHVLPEHQGRHLGSSLMESFHSYGNHLVSKCGTSSTTPFHQHLSCVATGLTVFSDNEKAFNWYIKLGYTFAPGSPLDKQLRNGKVRKPSAYTLSRPLVG